MEEIIKGIQYHRPLFITAALIIIMSVIFYFWKRKVERADKGWGRKHDIIAGIAFGLCAIYATEFGVNVNGIVVNVRNAAPLCAGLVVSSPAGIIAGVLGGVERWFAVYWGVGEYTRVACSVACVLCACIVALFRKLIFGDRHPSPFVGFFIALVTEVMHMLLVFLTHPADMTFAYDVMRRAAVPMITLACVTVVIVLVIVQILDYIDLKKQNIEHKKEKVGVTTVLQLKLLVIIIIMFFVLIAFESYVSFRFAYESARSMLTNNMNDRHQYFDGLLKKDDDDISKVMMELADMNIGETGAIMVTDRDFNPYVLVDINGRAEYVKFESSGLDEVVQNEMFTAKIDDKWCYCVYKNLGEGRLVGYLPTDEVYKTCRMIVYISVFVYVILFTMAFVLIYKLMHTVVVHNIKQINKTLDKITAGDLNNKAQDSPYKEFSILSSHINDMVESLKKLIKEAENRIATELEFSKGIQHATLPSVFPPFPNIKSFDIYATMNAAKEVGGDFYDFYFLNDNNKLLYLIADVSGKGITGAMFMMQAKSIIKGCAEKYSDIEEIATKANEELCANNEVEMFVTCFMSVIDLRTGHVECVNAGHNPPIICRKDGTVEYLKVKSNLVFAGMEGVKFKKDEYQLNPGDGIYMYTDGVTEAINVKEELYGEDRLIEVVKKHYCEEPKDLLVNVRSDLDQFVGEANQFDDITMLALNYKGGDN